jgi:antitoxin YefM
LLLLEYRSISNSMDRIVPISELQSQARRIVEGVKTAGDPVVITQRGRPAALLVNYEEYEGLIATLEEMSQPDWRDRLTEAERDSAKRRGTEIREFKARRSKRGHAKKG